MTRRYPLSTGRKRPARSGLVLILVLLAACASPAANPQGELQVQHSPYPLVNGPYPLPPTATIPQQILPQPTETPSPTALPVPTEPPVTGYMVQSGDTLHALARRFQAPVDSIQPDTVLLESGFLSPGLKLLFPGVAASGDPDAPLLPDSEVVYSPAAADFDVAHYVQQAGGYLAGHGEYLRSTGWNSSADIVSRVAREFSINPRLLLALLEYECGCLRGPLKPGADPDYLLGVPGYRNKGLYHQLEWASNRLSEGYYGWRSGALIEFTGTDGIMIRPSPGLNAGSVAVAYYFVQKALSASQGTDTWQRAIDPGSGVPALVLELFGDPWQRASASGVLVPGALAQPVLELPFEPGVLWSYSSGPHPAWGTMGAQAALDFAPAVPISGCVQTDAWVVAMADGLVVRSELGVVVQDLYLTQAEQPIDGLEQTGWTILYLHIADRQRVEKGTYLKAGDRIGHPSCEGGRANGTHVHVARRYNGEWMAAAGPVPFVLSDWMAHAGDAPYKGTLTMGRTTLEAHPNGSRQTQIVKP